MSPLVTLAPRFRMTPGGRLEALIRPTAGRLGFALRMALICALITIVIETYQLPSLATTVYAAFFLLRPTRGATLLASTVMPVFITFALGITLLLTMSVLDHPFWRIVVMTGFSFGVLFLGSASKFKPFAATFAVIVGYVLDLLGSLQIGEVATRALLYTWLVAAIPASICIAVSLGTGPVPRRLLGLALAERLRLASSALRGDNQAGIDQLAAVLRQGDGTLQELLAAARFEKALPGESQLAFRRAIASTLAVLTHVMLIGERDPRNTLRVQRDRIAETLDDMAAMLRAGGYPIDISPPHLSQEGLPSAFAEPLNALCAELKGFAQGHLAVLPAPRSGFMAPDAFTNPDHARFALKATIAAMACYLTFQQLDWPGIHTCLITCYVVALGSAGETIEKLTLRICGCLAGAALGFAVLIFILPGVDTIVGLTGIIALGTIPAAWVAAGGPRISYAGLQIAFAYYLIVLQGSAPAFDLALGRDRIIGIIFGNLMVYVIFTRLWPASICSGVDPAMAKLLRSLGAMVRAGPQGARWHLGPLRSTIAAIERLLEIARFEPLSLRPSVRWLQDRQDKLARIEALAAPLFLLASQDDEGGSEIMLQLDGLARQIEIRPFELRADAESGVDPAWMTLQNLSGMREVSYAKS